MSPLEVDIAQLAAALEGGATLIDVRQPDEYAEAHVPQAILVPLGDLVERIDEIPTVGAVYVICHSGGRSLKATQYLRNQGIDAYSVDGGTKGWIDSGRPSVVGSSDSGSSGVGAQVDP